MFFIALIISLGTNIHLWTESGSIERKVDSLEKKLEDVNKRHEIVEEACSVKVRSDAEEGTDRILVNNKSFGSTPRKVNLEPDSVYRITVRKNRRIESVTLKNCGIERVGRKSIWFDLYE